MADTTFSKLSDDIVLKIFFLLEDDPRNWARLSCTCSKFSCLISTVCCKSKCISTFPAISADLRTTSSSPPGGWESLHKIAVCCPGLLHAGVLLDNSDFGLERELGPDEDYGTYMLRSSPAPRKRVDELQHVGLPERTMTMTTTTTTSTSTSTNCEGWTLYDDLYYDTVYDNSEVAAPVDTDGGVIGTGHAVTTTSVITNEAVSTKKRKVVSRTLRSHLASGVWNLCREQGNKLLASRFRDDCLYICDWPGCVHMEEKRNYMLFRGIFKNFKRSRVWRTINDGNRSKTELKCAFCSCKETWDLHSSFCLKRGFGFHDDGDPVVRAYVCENGHVSGAWTDLPLYT